LARILGLVGLGAVTRNSVGSWDGDRGSFGGIVVSILGVVGEGGLGIRGCWWEPATVMGELVLRRFGLVGLNGRILRVGRLLS